MFLNINADASVVFTNKLEKLHRSGLPRAIRETLNKAALDVKKNTMIKSSKNKFDNRTNSNFFKANSRVNFAKGFDVNSMAAVVGFVDTKVKGQDNHAVDDLEKQEFGGVIGGRSFIPLKQARTSNSYKRVTKRKYRLADIKNNITDSKKSRGKTDAEKWTKAALFAGQGKFVIGTNTTANGNRIVFGIRKIGRKNGKTWIAKDPLFAVKANRQVRVRATHFMKIAATKSSKKMELIYAEEAKKVIKFLKNK